VKLFSKYTVFFEQVVDDVLLLTLDDTSHGEYEKLEGEVLGKLAHLNRCSAAFMCELRPESAGACVALNPVDRVFGQDGLRGGG
jgi:hypothetical protein